MSWEKIHAKLSFPTGIITFVKMLFILVFWFPVVSEMLMRPERGSGDLSTFTPRLLLHSQHTRSLGWCLFSTTVL